MSQEFIVSLKGISKSFGGVTVLDNVNFDLERGSVHALVGQNGAGKSTMMKILTGVYTCDSGEIIIDGKTRKITNYSQAVENGISLIFQELSLVPTLTVVENIFLNREIKKGLFVDMKAMEEKTKELLHDLNLDIDIHTKIADLDVGVCQMIEIAKALSINSRILVLDEPTASLSEKETANLFRLINDLKNKGVSMIYISHRMNEIFQICDYITVLRNGKIVCTKPTSDFTMESLIENMIGKKVESDFTKKDNTALVNEKKPLLTIKNLTYKNKVKNVSFDVYEGEVLGIAGLMGSGRTEIVETLFGLHPDASGEIELDGKPVSMKSVSSSIDAGLALIPEDRRREGLVLTHSVKENLVVPFLKKLKKGLILDQSKIKQIAKESIVNMAIKTNSPDTISFNLSGGNQQKIVVGKWLNSEPKILLLDEPTAGVDIGSKTEIIDKVKQFVGEKKAAIFISSDILELISACDRFIVLYDGVLTAEFTKEEITSEGVLQYAIQNGKQTA